MKSKEEWDKRNWVYDKSGGSYGHEFFYYGRIPVYKDDEEGEFYVLNEQQLREMDTEKAKDILRQSYASPFGKDTIRHYNKEVSRALRTVDLLEYKGRTKSYIGALNSYIALSYEEYKVMYKEQGQVENWQKVRDIRRSYHVPVTMHKIFGRDASQ